MDYLLWTAEALLLSAFGYVVIAAVVALGSNGDCKLCTESKLCVAHAEDALASPGEESFDAGTCGNGRGV